ncbi:homeobox-domain-containing protein [Laetiporus sulphureus 93-53]|uniref:Homeobox-domain-containing protein n=1 Tax=Laetiporus sulphureus 93-53 TaxID=1314785 RepID=A0A165BJB2_9APHY|nr:homeobox-domain-containing protein [Laetiporus sulphureus 93-53]KZT01166.1 homeobox-domain-containing protein [Laetiporus sulphureus 93-53]
MNAPLDVPRLSRTNSASSVSSMDTVASSDTVVCTDGCDTGGRRTRKRFTHVQLMMLEHLYHQTSHPTREQRDAVAKQGNMETRSVTIWFQNKRQTERRGRAFITSTSRPLVSSSDSPFSTTCGKTIHSVQNSAGTRVLTRSASDVGPSSRATYSQDIGTRTLEAQATSPAPEGKRTQRVARHLSLDDIASRSERPHPPDATTATPTRSVPAIFRTPPRPRPPSLWENMLSSPVATSPDPKADRAMLEFVQQRVKRSRTLEWACAAARVGTLESKTKEVSESEDALTLDLGEDSDDGEVHEALTPSSSQTSIEDVDGVCSIKNIGREHNVPIRLERGGSMDYRIRKAAADKRKGCVGARRMRDEDMMDAALALCGLGKLK